MRKLRKNCDRIVQYGRSDDFISKLLNVLKRQKYLNFAFLNFKVLNTCVMYNYYIISSTNVHRCIHIHT